MKKYCIIFLIVLTSFTAVSAPDSVANESEDNLRTINSGDSEISFSQRNGTCGMPENDTVSFNQMTEESESTITVEGTVNTPNPCYRLDYNLDKKEEKYVLEISSSSSKRICVQCTGSIDYTAQISIPEDMPLEVTHDGEQAGVFTPDSGAINENEERSRGLLYRILSFFGFR